LSAIGIYGVIACSVVQRTQEIGIRATLGASPANLVRLIVGAACVWPREASPGLRGGDWRERLLSCSSLRGISDSVTLIATAGVLAVVATVPATFRHARDGIDPLAALRAE